MRNFPSCSLSASLDYSTHFVCPWSTLIAFWWSRVHHVKTASGGKQTLRALSLTLIGSLFPAGRFVENDCHIAANTLLLPYPLEWFSWFHFQFIISGTSGRLWHWRLSKASHLSCRLFRMPPKYAVHNLSFKLFFWSRYSYTCISLLLFKS